MIFDCQKEEPGYWHCNMVHMVGRPPEDTQLEQELMLEQELIDMFPGMLKDVRLVGEEDE